MKTILRTILILGILFATFKTVQIVYRLAVPDPVPRSPQSIDYPKSIDLGHRFRGELLTIPFEVFNTGDDDLELSDFSTSCSCIRVEKEIDGQNTAVQRVIIPGRSKETLKLRLSVTGSPGRPEQYLCSFATNDPRVARAEIIMTIPQIYGISFMPSPILYNNVMADQHHTRELSIRNIGNVKTEIISVQSSQPNLLSVKAAGKTPDSTELSSLRADLGKYTVTLAPHPPGQFAAEIRVTVLAADVTQTHTVPVFGTVVAPFVAAPNSMRLPRRSSAGDIREFTSLLSTNTGKPFRIQVGKLPTDFTVEIVDSDPSLLVKYATIRWNPSSTMIGERIVEIPFLISTETGNHTVSITVDCRKEP